MKKLLKHDGLATRAVLAIGLIVTIAIGISILDGRRGVPKITSDLIGERLQYVQDLVSVEYYYKDVSSIERSRLQLLGINISFTGNRAILSYEGVIKYGVDVSQAEIDVSGDIITLTLPEGKMISHEVPEDSIEIFDEGKNVFNPITIRDYVNFQSERKAEMEAHALEKGFPNMAREKAGESLKAMLNLMPGMEDYKITVTIQSWDRKVTNQKNTKSFDLCGEKNLI